MIFSVSGKEGKWWSRTFINREVISDNKSVTKGISVSEPCV